MEKNIKLKFHVFKINTVATLILVEPKQKVYIWVYLYVDKSLRSGMISTELTKYVLFYLKGIHHIHWFPYLKAFQVLSRVLKWKTKSKSTLFENCNHSVTYDLKKPNSLFPIFRAIVSHKITNRKPSSLVYESRKDEYAIIDTIKSTYLTLK